MRVERIAGTRFRCPMYLGRAGPAWQVRVPGHPSRTFTDGVIGGPEKSYAAALAYRKTLAPMTEVSKCG